MTPLPFPLDPFPLDDTLFKLQAIERGQLRYPFWDFLYFSAVTITTVGYGDILPGDTTARMLVMTEAMLGVILMGAFVSSLFWRPDNLRPNLPLQRIGCAGR